ncbi:MAG: hypothetical protein A3J37_06195, partial [Alphaproteobacteria bacterium RIFCSPHIGHO2_12_FULL_45_9]
MNKTTLTIVAAAVVVALAAFGIVKSQSPAEGTSSVEAIAPAAGEAAATVGAAADAAASAVTNASEEVKAAAEKATYAA